MTANELLEVIESYASARSSGNVRLTVWAGQQLKAAILSLPESTWTETQNTTPIEQEKTNG